MRGIPSSVTDIRKKVFTEVARLAYDGAYDRMENAVPPVYTSVMERG